MQREDPVWETMIIVIDKTHPNQGFGIAISGGVDNPHFKTGSTAIVVSDIVPGSPSDGLLSVRDEILFINNNNMSTATHDDAVQALREAGMKASMVIRRIQPDSDHELSVPQEVTYNIHNESDIIWRSKLVLAKNSAPIIDEQQLPQDDEYNVHNEARTLWNSDTILAERSASADADQQPPKPEIKMKLVGFSEVLALNAGDNKTRVTLQKDFAGNGFTMGELYYVRERGGNGPVLKFGDSRQGERVLEINSKPLDHVKTLAEAIELVLGSTNQMSLLLETHAVIDSEPHVKDSEPLLAEEAPVDLQAEPAIAKYEMQTTWKSIYNTKEPEKGDDTDHSNDSKDSLLKEDRIPVQVEPVLQQQVHDSYASSWEQERNVEVHVKRPSMGNDGRYITFEKSGNLGIQITGGNAVGIFIAVVHQDSAAAMAGLKQGDQILEANEIDFRQITREEAVLILLALGEEVSLFVVPQKAEFERIKSQPGDNFFVRANFNSINKSSNNEFSFRKGDIFNIKDTMYQGLIGSWHAKRVGKKGELLDKGILPNKSRAEQLARAQFTEERVMRKAHGVKFTSEDKLDDLSFAEANYQVPAYERVVLRVADSKRPIVILGPCADLASMLLVNEMPDQFAFPMQADSFGQRSRTFPRSGGNDKSYGDSVKFSSIRKVVQEDKHCLLNLTPDDIEKLIVYQMCPIVILLKTYSDVAVKALRSSLVDQLKRSPTSGHHLTEDPLSKLHVKKMHSITEKLEELYPHIFTAKLNTHIVGSTLTNREWYEKMKEIIFRQQSEMAWMPEGSQLHPSSEEQSEVFPNEDYENRGISTWSSD